MNLTSLRSLCSFSLSANQPIIFSSLTKSAPTTNQSVVFFFHNKSASATRAVLQAHCLIDERNFRLLTAIKAKAKIYAGQGNNATVTSTGIGKDQIRRRCVLAWEEEFVGSGRDASAGGHAHVDRWTRARLSFTSRTRVVSPLFIRRPLAPDRDARGWMVVSAGRSAMPADGCR